MLSWEGNPYWVRADNIAYCMYQHVTDLMERRGKTFSSFSFSKDLLFDLSSEPQIEVDIIHNLSACPELKVIDNIAACLADDNYSEIEITTLIPKGKHVKAIKKNKQFQWDLLNVIRHELEHTIQGVDINLTKPVLIDYNRSDNNFLLDPAEVPAYVHGFRISTKSRAHFLTTITQFINMHSKTLSLDKSEVSFTVNTWYDYLKNLNYHSNIKKEKRLT